MNDKMETKMDKIIMEENNNCVNKLSKKNNMKNQHKYICLKIFRKINFKKNNCKIQIWNRRKYYEVQITHFSITNDEINKRIKNVLEKYDLIKFIYGHRNIVFEINSSKNIMEINNIILNVTKIFYN
jgi:hypothetical protein